MRTSLARTLCGLLLATACLAEPLYKSSVVGTDYDFITDGDPSTFAKLAYMGVGLAEMPDKRNNDWPLRKKAHLFIAHYNDNTHVQISVHAGIGDKAACEAVAMRAAPRIGKLPTSLRKGLRRVVMQPGGRNTTAFADRGMFVLYAANTLKRISTHDLEETIFHESVHAAWDKEHRRSKGWKNAQTKDATFITRYAKNNPVGEDLAETSLFAYTILHHPKRFPKMTRAAIKKAIPHRIAFIKKLLPVGKPVHYRVKSNLKSVQSSVNNDLRRFAQAPDAPTHNGWRDIDKANQPKPKKGKTCNVDLNNPARLSDLLSNTLVRGVGRKEKDVAAFLRGPNKVQAKTSTELFRATAKRFEITEDDLLAGLRKFLHCNCGHMNLDAKIDDDKMRVLQKALRR